MYPRRQCAFNVMNTYSSPLKPRHTQGAKVEALSPGCYRLSIPGGKSRDYRWAQLDDYKLYGRDRFFWQAPCALNIRARVSQDALSGTWGFGFWNDPFTASLGLGGMARRLPALPNTAWFFHASPPNYLSLRDDLPAQGFLAAVFSSALVPSPLLAPSLLAFPLLAWRPAARLFRRLSRWMIKEDSCRVETTQTDWHSYHIELTTHSSSFKLDGVTLYETPAVPQGRLGLVLWIDNQYAGFDPTGRLKYGTLENPPAWLEIEFINLFFR